MGDVIYVWPLLLKLSMIQRFFFQSGICRSNLERWYFDIQSGYCKDFGYTGCGGNKNNFPTKEKCEQTCGQNSNQISPDYQPNYWSNNNGMYWTAPFC